MFEPTPKTFISQEASDFYIENQGQAIDKLLFKHGKDPQKKVWISQIESRRRALEKLPIWHENSRIVFPPIQLLQQASSEETAKYKASLVGGNTCADLTGGTGVDSWQLSQKFIKHQFVEPNPQLIELAQHNFDVLGINNLAYHQTTAEDFIHQTKEIFDWIYVDPSRRKEGGNKVFLLHDYQPNVLDMLPELLSRGNQILVKVSAMADISYLMRAFEPYLHEIHVVAANNSCKEILIILKKNTRQNPTVYTVNLGKTEEIFHFEIADEQKDAPLANEIEAYIFEPNAAVLKAGAFNSIANAFQLSKLDKSSHLYTGAEIKLNFPGKTYAVAEVAAPFKLKNNYLGAEISIRNFNLKEAEIRKKMKLKESQVYRLFATQLQSKRCFVMTKKIE